MASKILRNSPTFICLASCCNSCIRSSEVVLATFSATDGLSTSFSCCRNTVSALHNLLCRGSLCREAQSDRMTTTRGATLNAATPSFAPKWRTGKNAPQYKRINTQGHAIRAVFLWHCMLMMVEAFLGCCDSRRERVTSEKQSHHCQHKRKPNSNFILPNDVIYLKFKKYGLFEDSRFKTHSVPTCLHSTNAFINMTTANAAAPIATPATSNHSMMTETRSTETDRRFSRRPRQQRRTFVICPLLQWRGLRWSIPKRQRCMEFVFDSFSTLLEWFVYGIGPLLILLALSIMLVLSYTFFYILLPMIHHKYLHSPYRSMILMIHITIVTCILINVLFNYICCVIQKHSGKHYDRVIQECAALCNVTLPSTPQELVVYRRDLIERLSQRMQQRESEQPAGNAPPRAWMLLGPYEWGYCSHSQQAKPPRAHYDHVTKCLVLNLDHYCPWMFNASA